MALDKSQKNFLRETLDTMSFVKWDRFIPASEEQFYVYGWIKRKHDQYKDFVVLELDLVRLTVNSFVTSSALHSKKISELFEFDHVDCKRVEELLA